MHENLPHFVIQAKFLRRILRLYWQPLSNIFYRNIQGLSSVSFNPVAKIQDSSSQTLTKIRHSSEDATLPNLYCDKHINNVVKPTIRPIVVRNLSNLGTEKVSNNINRRTLDKVA